MTTSTEPIFTIGQKVTATGSYNWLLTEGKEYIVVKYEPECRSDNGMFTFPAYVSVIGDSGKRVAAHTYRFKAVDE